MPLRDRIAQHEGCRLEAYPDPKSGGAPWTIGYGHTGKDVTWSTKWSKQQADDQLDRDIALAKFCVTARLPWFDELTPDRKDAMVELCFNMGIGRNGPPASGLLAFKHMLAAMAAGDYETAAKELLNSQWHKDVGEKRANCIADLIRGHALKGD